MDKTKYLSALERVMAVGARRTGLSVSSTATLLCFSHLTVSCVYQEWSTTQRHAANFDTTVRSIGVNMGQHLCGTLSAACRVHALTNVGCSEGKRG